MSQGFDWQALYPQGVNRAYEPPRKYIWQFLEETARKYPEKPALLFNELTVPYGRLWNRVRISASVLRSRGFARGKRSDRVMLVLPNCPEFVVHYYAALRADMVVVAVNPKLTRDELLPLIVDTEPRAAFVHVDCAGEFEAARVAAHVREPKVFYVRSGHEFKPGRGDSSVLPQVLGEPDPSESRTDLDVAVLQYTSGTTGGLKAAMISHRNLVANAEQNNRWFGWNERDVILGALPLCHTWGMCCVMNAAIAAGATISLIEEFNAARVVEEIENHAVTVAYGSGTMFQRILDSAGESASDAFASLRYVKAGAMLIDRTLNERWAGAVPEVPMINGYGLTEASPEVTNNPPGRVKVGTVGLPLPGTDLRLCHPEAPETPVEPGQEGEIQVRGPQVMLGYWSEPAATRLAILPGGWLRTGDIGAFDEEGYLRIVDRLKDLIKFRGNSIAPGEVEKLLLTHPGVREACVVGMPDAADGEVPVAFVVLKEGAPLDVTDLPDFVEPHLASFKRPRRFHIVHEIPKNHVGKPLRRVLREMPEPGAPGLAK
ncbi:MAG: AMP-binding protein [Planctomycetes bacterium]|nr:AMP-binding protein [Planctomycetota bacterium]